MRRWSWKKYRRSQWNRDQQRRQFKDYCGKSWESCYIWDLCFSAFNCNLGSQRWGSMMLHVPYQCQVLHSTPLASHTMGGPWAYEWQTQRDCGQSSCVVVEAEVTVQIRKEWVGKEVIGRRNWQGAALSRNWIVGFCFLLFLLGGKPYWPCSDFNPRFVLRISLGGIQGPFMRCQEFNLG